MLFYERKPRLQSQPLTGARAAQSYSLVPLQHLPSAAVSWPSLQSLIANNAPLGRRHHSSASAAGAAASADQMHLQRAQHAAGPAIRSQSTSTVANGDESTSTTSAAQRPAVADTTRSVESLRAWVQADNVTLLRAVSFLNEETIDLVEQLCSAVQPQSLPLVDEQNANRVYVDSALLAARFFFQVLVYIRSMFVALLF